jgi:hypothetical protein
MRTLLPRAQSPLAVLRRFGPLALPVFGFVGLGMLLAVDDGRPPLPSKQVSSSRAFTSGEPAGADSSLAGVTTLQAAPRAGVAAERTPLPPSRYPPAHGREISDQVEALQRLCRNPDERALLASLNELIGARAGEAGDGLAVRSAPTSLAARRRQLRLARRGRGAALAAEYPSANARAALVALLGDPDPNLRTQAIRGLVKWSDFEPELLRLISAEEAPNVLHVAFVIFAEHGTTDAIPQLLSRSQDASLSRAVRDTAIRAIHKISNRLGLPPPVDLPATRAEETRASLGASAPAASSTPRRRRN